jgi:hypothetical protein
VHTYQQTANVLKHNILFFLLYRMDPFNHNVGRGIVGMAREPKEQAAEQAENIQPLKTNRFDCTPGPHGVQLQDGSPAAEWPHSHPQPVQINKLPILLFFFCFE